LRVVLQYASVPHVKEGVRGILGQWMNPDGMQQELAVRLPGSMTGRFMYVIPFSMGPVGGPLSKVGIQLTDFVYVVLSMGIMTRVSPDIWKVLEGNGGEFVR
jgi:phosphoenolpyruvate carboxykinase (GTP)